MRIKWKSSNRSFTIPVPNIFFTSPNFLAFGYWVVKKTSGKYSPQPMPELSAAQLKGFCRELKRIRKQHGHYELLLVEGADGDLVRITL